MFKNNIIIKIQILASILISTAYSAFAAETKLACCGDGDYFIYINYDVNEPYWRPLTIKDFNPGLFNRAIPSISKEEFELALDRLQLGPESTHIRISMLEEALEVMAQRVFFDSANDYFEAFEDYQKPSVHFALFENAHEELQRLIEEALLAQRDFEEIFFHNEIIPLKISEREINEGNCFIYASARVLGYKGKEILQFHKNADQLLGYEALTHDTMVRHSKKVPLDEVREGDWVYYPGNPENPYFDPHWGVVIKKEGNDVFVESKWGMGVANFVRIHKVEQVPPRYGSFATFYRLDEEYKKIFKDL